MEMADLSLYTDAIACLQHTVNEGKKKTNVDIRMMLCQIQRCQVIVQELLRSEHQAIFYTSLTSLQANLECHVNILTKKISQLSENPQKAQTSSKESNDPSCPYFNFADRKCDVNDNTSEVSVSESAKTKNALAAVSSNEPKNGLNAELQCSESRKMVVESTIVTRRQVKFTDVIGLQEAKQSLHDTIVMPLIFPHLFDEGCRSWKGILLYGPPGTGKSYLAQAVASEVEATFYRVSSTDLMSSWVGESEKLVKELFQHADSQKRQSVIFIDEIDSLCRQRNAREEEGSRRLKTELLLQMDRQQQVLILGATNCPWELDTAFLRRFQRRIYVSLPDLTARVEILKLHCKNKLTDLTDGDWKEIASRTRGYSGSDLATLTTGVFLKPIRELHKATRWRSNKDGQYVPCADDDMGGIKALWSDLPGQKIHPRTITKEDFLTCLSRHQPTVREEELQKYEHFTSTFGFAG